MNYKEKIQQAKEEKEKAEKEKLLQKEKEFDEYLSKIESLKDRIKELLDIGQELYNNSFPLEIVRLDFNYKKYPMGQFFTEGSFHHLGFYSPARKNFPPPDYLGVSAGGWDGKFDLMVDKNGQVYFVNEDTRCIYNRVDDGDTRKLIKKFLEEFDTFEKRVHLYLDHLNDEKFRHLPYEKWNEILENVPLHTNKLKEVSGR